MVWQPLQLKRKFFCCSVPGMLKQPFSIGKLRRRIFGRFEFEIGGGGFPGDHVDGLGDRRDRNRRREFSERNGPGSSFSPGKANRPLASLTTLTVIVEPSFFAPTTTPSIKRSFCELTRPVSAMAPLA